MSGVVHCVLQMHSNQSFHVLNSPFPIIFRSLPYNKSRRSTSHVTTVRVTSEVKSQYQITQYMCVMKYLARDFHLSTFCCSTRNMPDRPRYCTTTAPYISTVLLCIFTDNLLCILIHYQLSDNSVRLDHFD